MPGPNTPTTFEEWLATLVDGVQFFQAWQDNALGAANELALMDGGGAAEGLEIVTDQDAYFQKALKIPNLQPAHLALSLTDAADDIELLVRLRVDAVLSEQELVTENGSTTSSTVRADRVYVGLGALLQADEASALLGAGLSMTNRGASCSCGPACQLGPGHAGFRPATGSKLRQTLRGVSRTETDDAFLQRSTLEHEEAVSGEPVITADGTCPDEQTQVGNQVAYHYMRLRVTRTAAAKATIELGWFREQDVYTSAGSSTVTKWLNTIVKDVAIPEADGFGGLLLVAREDNVGNTYVDWISGSIDPDNNPAPFPPIARTADCPLPPATEGQPYTETLDPLGDFQEAGCVGSDAGEETGLESGLLYVLAEGGMAGFGRTGVFDPRQTQGGRRTMGYGNVERRSGGKGGEAVFGGHGGAAGAPGANGADAPIGSLTDDVFASSTDNRTLEFEGDCAEGLPASQVVDLRSHRVHGAVNPADPTNVVYWGGFNFNTFPIKFPADTELGDDTPWQTPGRYVPVPASVALEYLRSTGTPAYTQEDQPVPGEFCEALEDGIHVGNVDMPAGVTIDPLSEVGKFNVPRVGLAGSVGAARGGGGAGAPPPPYGYDSGAFPSDIPFTAIEDDADVDPVAGPSPVGLGGRGYVKLSYNHVTLGPTVFQGPGNFATDFDTTFNCANILDGVLTVECWAGGGSGGVGLLSALQGTGGGGGAYSKSIFTGLTDEILNIHIGPGGVATWDPMLEEWVIQDGGDTWVQEVDGAMAPEAVVGDPCDFWQWEVEGLPPGLTLDSATGRVTGTPPVGSAGTFEVTITVKNGTYKSTPKKCPFLIFRGTDSRTAKSRGGGRDMLLYGTEGGRVNVPDAVQDFTSEASMEEKIICAVRSKTYAPMGTDGEMTLRRLYIEVVHRQAAVLWVLPIIDGQPMRDLRSRIQLPAPPAGTTARAHRWIPIYQEQEGYTTGVRCQNATLYVEISDPVDEVNLQAAAWAHEALDVARMRRAGELETNDGGATS